MPAGLVCNYNPVFLQQPILYPTMPLVSLPQHNSTSSRCPNGPHLEPNGLQTDVSFFLQRSFKNYSSTVNNITYGYLSILVGIS